MKTMYFESKVADIYFNQKFNAVFLEYKSRVPSHQEFVSINTKVLEFFSTLDTNTFVADIHRMGIIGIESQKWVAEVLLPGLIKQLKDKGLVHAQLLDSNEVLAKVSGNQVKQKAAEQIEGFELHQFFESESLEKFLLDKK